MLYTAKVVWVNGLNLKKLKTNKMELKQAIGILETHNRWRRGEDVEPMIDPTAAEATYVTIIKVFAISTWFV